MKDYSAEIDSMVKVLGSIALNESKRVCPVRTGRLKRSITKNVIHDRANNTDSVIIFTTVPYAKNVEYGGINHMPKPFLGAGAEAARKSAAFTFSLFLRGDRS